MTWLLDTVRDNDPNVLDKIANKITNGETDVSTLDIVRVNLVAWFVLTDTDGHKYRDKSNSFFYLIVDCGLLA